MRIPPARYLLAIILLLCTHVSSAERIDSRYAYLVKQTAAMRNSTYCRVMQMGKSSHGRPLYAIVITDPQNSSSICSNRVRVLFMCGQHGDEPSSVISMLGLAKELSQTRNHHYKKLLRKSVIILVPAVNPDGLANRTRLSGDGADLNRDWQNPTQPETKAVYHLIRSFHPNIVVDMHEWLDNTSWRSNGIEVAGFGSDRQYKLARLLAGKTIADMPQKGVEMHLSSYRAESNPTLAHRSISRMGTCSMLVETSQSWSPQMRQKAYKNLAISMLDTLVYPSDKQTSGLIAATMKADRPADKVLAELYVPKPSPISGPNPEVLWPAAAILACCLIMKCCKGNKFEANPEAVLNSRRPVTTDIMLLAISPRAKVAVIRKNRHRPSDRVSQKRHSEAFLVKAG